MKFTILLIATFGCCLMSLSSSSIIDLEPMVSTSSGRIFGQKTILNNNAEVYQFLGVPYAQPPVGENRFQKPKPIVDSWSNIVFARKFKPACMQMKHLAKTINPLLDVDLLNDVSEDCLYLNIYVPADVEDYSSLPVMVWLPGEGYDFADARQFNGAYLASNGKVIVVTVQYRVGIFGFLKENAGLWDQLMALRWINQNIEYFGGNPNDVTLFGRFTGSMSISILLSSPQINNNPVSLFNRAILMSGIAVGNWVFDKRTVQQKQQQFFESHRCAHESCLTKIPAKEILEKSSFGWKPFIDNDLIEEEPLNAIRNGKFSRHIQGIMLGSNRFEGSLCLLKHLVVDEQFYGKLIRDNVTVNDVERIIREDLHMFYEDDDHYDHNKHGAITNRDSYLEFCSELLIDSHMSEYGSVLRNFYFSRQLQEIIQYKVDYKPTFSIAPEFINSSIHGDDVLLAFGLAYKNQNINQDDQKITDRMIKLFSQFATNGLVQSPSDRYLTIESDLSPKFQEKLSKEHHHRSSSWSGHRFILMEAQQTPMWMDLTGLIILVAFIILFILIAMKFLFSYSHKITKCPHHRCSTPEQIKKLIQQNI